MADVAIILGKSGTGKSTSLKTLDPKSTVVINIKGKRLPFKGSAGMYNTENKNLFNVDNPAEVVSLLKAINGTTHIKTVIIDDFIYMMRTEYFNRIKEKGFDKVA
jgi:ABC-type nitrate/sulfonate/bicarbonate transport system ATPase subunit